eukprot:Em0022g726a
MLTALSPVFKMRMCLHLHSRMRLCVQPPVLKDEGVRGSPVLKDESVRESPVLKDASVRGPPVLKDESARGPPVFKDEGVRGSPVFKDEGVRGSPVFKDEGVRAWPPVLKDEHVSGPPVFKDEGVRGPPVCKSVGVDVVGCAALRPDIALVSAGGAGQLLGKQQQDSQWNIKINQKAALTSCNLSGPLAAKDICVTLHIPTVSRDKVPPAPHEAITDVAMLIKE